MTAQTVALPTVGRSGRIPRPPVTVPPLPLLRLLDALDAWARRPTRPYRAALRDAFEAYLAAIGASGAYLRIDAPPLPPLRLGLGTVRRRPRAGYQGRCTEHVLRANDGRVELGTLVLDGPPQQSELAFRALELPLDAAWARTETRTVADSLAGLDAATRAISGVLSVDRVLQLIVDNVRRLVGARYAALGIVEDGQVVDPFITSGISRPVRERIGAPPRGHGLLGVIVQEGRSLRVRDIAADPRRAGFPPYHPEMRSLLGVPIQVKGRVIGNLYLTDKLAAAEFSESDQRLVEMFASHAGIAIENARLHEQVQLLAVLEERQRIGRDLHDGIIQSIYAVGLGLDDAYELVPEDPAEARVRIERAIEQLNLTIRDIRNFIFGLRPEPLEQATLVDALAAMAEEFRINTMIDISLQVRGDGDLETTSDVTSQLLHLTREALSNVARHAHADHAEITLAYDAHAIELAIADDGIGFDPALRRGPGHLGLSNMRTRAADLGGDLQVESTPGGGTRVVVRVPREGAGHEAPRPTRE